MPDAPDLLKAHGPDADTFFMLAPVPRLPCIYVQFSPRSRRVTLARVVILALGLAGIVLGAVPLAAQSPPPAGDGGLPVSVAEELLDDAFGQAVGSSESVVLRRSRSGKIGLVVTLAVLLVSLRLLHLRRGASDDGEGPGTEIVVEPVRLPDHESRVRRERLDRSVDGGRRSYRPYRSRDEKESTPLALPPHVLAILARTHVSGGPAPEGEAAPYHAPDNPLKPPAVDEPPEQRLDLVVPGFTPWRKKK